MKKNRVLTIATWLGVFLLWYILTATIFKDTVVFPTPAKVINAFIDILNNGYNRISLFMHIYTSFKRMIIAVIFAIITAIPIGLLSGYSSKVKSVVDSIVQFYRPIPPLAYYTLLVLWMGIDDESKIMLLFLAAFAPIYLACVSAVSQVRKDYVLNALSLGATSRQVFFHVVLPASMPQVFTGLRTAIGFAYTTLVSAEMVAASSGIGWMVLDASRFLKTDVQFVGIVIMGLTGVLIDIGLQKLEVRYVFWKGK